MLKNKTILLTGGTGFLGSNLLNYLANNKSLKIIVLKRSFSNTSRIYKFLDNTNIIFYDCDKVNLENIFKTHKIDAIIHCATEYGRTPNSIDKILEANLMLPLKLLDLSVKYCVNVFINTDSYFNKENSSYSYLKDYSLSKKNLLSWLNIYSQKIKIINMRLEHIFGYNDNNEKFCKYVFNKIVSEQVPFLDMTYGDQKRDFIYIDDVIRAFEKALEYAFTYNFRLRNFDIGTGIATPIKDFVAYIAKLAGNNTKINYGAIPYREDEIMCSRADTIELLNLDFKPEYSYTDGIDKMFLEYKKENTNV